MVTVVRKNPLKLNPLQLRTLVLAQVLAGDPVSGRRDAETGEITLIRLPHAHGNHAHVGPYSLPARALSGFENQAVWVALDRKGLARREENGMIVVTAEGMAYETGLMEELEKSDH